MHHRYPGGVEVLKRKKNHPPDNKIKTLPTRLRKQWNLKENWHSARPQLPCPLSSRITVMVHSELFGICVYNRYTIFFPRPRKKSLNFEIKGLWDLHKGESGILSHFRSIQRPKHMQIVKTNFIPKNVWKVATYNCYATSPKSLTVVQPSKKFLSNLKRTFLLHVSK